MDFFSVFLIVRDVASIYLLLFNVISQFSVLRICLINVDKSKKICLQQSFSGSVFHLELDDTTIAEYDHLSYFLSFH
jgi:hypothetical protein